MKGIEKGFMAIEEEIEYGGREGKGILRDVIEEEEKEGRRNTEKGRKIK